MSDLRQIQRARLQVQVVLAERSPLHLEHLRQETGSNDFGPDDLVMHFAGHKNSHGRTFASVFARIYQRYEEKILSADNMWYAGRFFQREPTPAEATLYYLAYRKKFGLSVEKLPLVTNGAQ